MKIKTLIKQVKFRKFPKPDTKLMGSLALYKSAPGMMLFKPIPNGIKGTGGFGKNLGVQLSFNCGDVNRYFDVPVYVNFPKDPPPPPGVKGEVEGEDEKVEVDISGCILNLINALRKIGEDAQEHAEKREKGEDVPPEGVVLKKGAEDAAKALKTFEGCVNGKGLSAHEAIDGIIRDEAKRLVIGFIKDKLKNLDTHANKCRTTMAGTIRDYKKKLEEEQFSIVKACQDFVSYWMGWSKETEKVCKDYEEDRKDLHSVFTGLTSEYMKIIRDAGGLTAARPKVVKNLEKAWNDLDESAIDVAAAELKAQRLEVMKDADKSDKKAKAFEKAMLALESDLA